MSRIAPAGGFSFFGWQDFADQGIVLPTIPAIDGGTVQLTNDASGTLTDGNTNVNGATTLRGVTDLWNSTNNCFNFGDTGIHPNDFLTIRFDFLINPNVVPLSPRLRLKFFDALNLGGSQVFALTRDLPDVDANAGSQTAFLPEIGIFVG